MSDVAAAAAAVDAAAAAAAVDAAAVVLVEVPQAARPTDITPASKAVKNFFMIIHFPPVLVPILGYLHGVCNVSRLKTRG
jgi:hypothetical protein